MIHHKIILNYFKIIYYYILLITGLCVISLLIWSRFIRERLPKDIPYSYLTEFRFWILVYICCITVQMINDIIIFAYAIAETTIICELHNDATNNQIT